MRANAVANFEMISNRSTLQLIRLTTKNIFQTVIIHTVYDIFFCFFIFVMNQELKNDGKTSKVHNMLRNLSEILYRTFVQKQGQMLNI